MKTVPLHGKHALGRPVLVDDADYDLVIPYHWMAKAFTFSRWTEGPYATGYLPGGPGRKPRVLMHTLLTGWPRVDHWDGDGLNNQRSNLRPATASQNGANRRPGVGHASQYKGVGRTTRGNAWRARITFQGKLHHLGTFADELGAAKAYDAAAKELFGAYARLNFPDYVAS
jgi:hypothetical protein